VAFKYAYDAGLIDKPVRFGSMFKRPSKRILRAERQKRGPRILRPATAADFSRPPTSRSRR
jgi:hypothetical protein